MQKTSAKCIQTNDKRVVNKVSQLESVSNLTTSVV